MTEAVFWPLWVPRFSGCLPARRRHHTAGTQRVHDRTHLPAPSWTFTFWTHMPVNGHNQHKECKTPKKNKGKLGLTLQRQEWRRQQSRRRSFWQSLGFGVTTWTPTKPRAEATLSCVNKLLPSSRSFSGDRSRDKAIHSTDLIVVLCFLQHVAGFTLTRRKAFPSLRCSAGASPFSRLSLPFDNNWEWDARWRWLCLVAHGNQLL